MRHVLGVLGILAAGVLLAVSCAMNYRFGFSLGRTEFDGQIYGAASAAADCLKALTPFFFFAAIKNRVWSQAAASALVWVVVTAYSMTSALGHAALNRFDSTGHRAQEAQVYQDLRAELKKAEEQSGWIPQHRPQQAVQSAIDGMKTQNAWKSSAGCRDASSRSEQKFCQQYHALNAELASASGGKAANTRIAEIKAKLAGMEGSNALSEADPQAKVLTELAAAFVPGIKMDDVQMTLTIFVALLLEIGSGFGMYVAFSQWRLYDVKPAAAPVALAAAEPVAVALPMPAAAPAAATFTPVPEPALAPSIPAPVAPAAEVAAVREVDVPKTGANDNKTIEPAVQQTIELKSEPVIEAPTVEVVAVEEKKLLAPATARVPLSDGEKFSRDNLDQEDGAAVSLHEAYKAYESLNRSRNRSTLSKRRFEDEIRSVGMSIVRDRHGQKLIKDFTLNRDARAYIRQKNYKRAA